MMGLFGVEERCFLQIKEARLIRTEGADGVANAGKITRGWKNAIKVLIYLNLRELSWLVRCKYQ
jgi:hypothetical protein